MLSLLLLFVPTPLPWHLVHAWLQLEVMLVMPLPPTPQSQCRIGLPVPNFMIHSGMSCNIISSCAGRCGVAFQLTANLMSSSDGSSLSTWPSRNPRSETATVRTRFAAGNCFLRELLTADTALPDYPSQIPAR